MEEMDDKRAALEELMQFARGGMAKEMRQRHGKPLDPEPEELAADEAPAEDPEIPGVEAETEGEDLAAAGDVAGEGVLDPETMRALLAQLKAKGG